MRSSSRQQLARVQLRSIRELHNVDFKGLILTLQGLNSKLFLIFRG